MKLLIHAIKLYETLATPSRDYWEPIPINNFDNWRLAQNQSTISRSYVKTRSKPKTWSWGLLVDDWWSRWSRMYSHTSQQAQSSHETNQNLADQRKTQIIEREKAKAIRDPYDELCFDWYAINVALQPLHEGRQSSTHEHENQSLSRTLISTSRTHVRTRAKAK